MFYIKWFDLFVYFNDIYIIDSRGSCEDYSNIPLETLGIKQVTYHLFIRLDVLSFLSLHSSSSSCPCLILTFMIYWPVQPPGGVDPNAHQRSEQVPQGQFPIQHLQLYASRYPTISKRLSNDFGFGGKLFYKSFLL